MQKIAWTVVHWKWKWKSLWFPTANIELDESWKPKAKSWVYKINIIIDWKKYSWAWFISSELCLCEVHIFDFNQDIYAKEVEVVLLKKIREKISFDSDSDLITKIKKDIKEIKKIKFTVLTFWTFDKLHKGHEYYLFEASKFWDVLITIVWRDEIVQKIKWRLPVNEEKKRLQNVRDLWVSNIVELWDLKDMYLCIKKYLPNVICFWYDQNSFSEWLLSFLKNNELNSEIIKIESFYPEIYKSSLIK